jgi:hypothetical protein
MRLGKELETAWELERNELLRSVFWVYPGKIGSKGTGRPLVGKSLVL